LHRNHLPTTNKTTNKTTNAVEIEIAGTAMMKMVSMKIIRVEDAVDQMQKMRPRLNLLLLLRQNQNQSNLLQAMSKTKYRTAIEIVDTAMIKNVLMKIILVEDAVDQMQKMLLRLNRLLLNNQLLNLQRQNLLQKNLWRSQMNLAKMDLMHLVLM